MEKYEVVKDLGTENFGVARLLRCKETKKLVPMKYIEGSRKIDESVAREIINHRSLRHSNIIRFKEVVLTPTHLAIVMEYAFRGELFEKNYNTGDSVKLKVLVYLDVMLMNMESWKILRSVCILSFLLGSCFVYQSLHVGDAEGDTNPAVTLQVNASTGAG